MVPEFFECRVNGSRPVVAVELAEQSPAFRHTILAVDG